MRKPANRLANDSVQMIKEINKIFVIYNPLKLIGQYDFGKF
jgi:hypothetical protein